MILKKGSLRPGMLINRSHLLNGMLLGILFSYSLYGVFYFLREIIRILTFDLGGLLLILSPKETFYYNLFYGSIAAILGFYITIKFIFENSINQPDKKIRFRQKQILHEQSFLFWVFLGAFGRLASIIGIWFLSMHIQYNIDFIKEFWLLLILFPVVIFLNIWPPILRTLGKKGYQWLFLSFIYIGIQSLIYANINFIDYQKINKVFNSKLIELVYDMKVPVSQTHHKITRRSLMMDIYLLKDSTEVSLPILFWKDISNKIDLKDLKMHINSEREWVADAEKDHIIANLHIDENISMKWVNQLKYELRKVGVRVLQYSTGVKNSVHPSYFPPHKEWGIPDKLPIYFSEFENFLDSAENLNFSKYTIKVPHNPIYRYQDLKKINRIEIKVDNENIFINNEPVAVEKLQSIAYKFIRKYTPDYRIIFVPDESISYKDYIFYLDLIHTTVGKLRNEMSYELYEEPLDLFKDWKPEFKQITEKYPVHIVEWTPEEKRLNMLMEKAGIKGF